MSIQITIDNKMFKLDEGSTLLQAARSQGIDIPSMCYHPDVNPFTSCMVCVVKDKVSGKLVPACSTYIQNGMDIDTSGEEVLQARRTALELLLSEHAGDCEGPCRRACPADMNIPLMLKHISTGRIREALITVKDHIALPAVLGRICPAPCEKACRRSQLDSTVAVCLLKRVVADADLASESPYLPPIAENTDKKIAIIGSGPAGLAAAFHLRQFGHQTIIFEGKDQPGGMLRNGVSKLLLPHAVLDAEIGIIKKIGVEFRMGKLVGSDISSVMDEFDALIIATGEEHQDISSSLGLELTGSGIRIDPKTHETSSPGVFAGGNAVRATKLAVRSVGHGRAMAISIHQYLSGRPVTGPSRSFNSVLGKLDSDEIEAYFQIPADKEKTLYISHEEKTAPTDAVTSEQAIEESRRCLECACLKPNDCRLREYATEMEAKAKSFPAETRSHIEKIHHPAGIVFEPGKCIKCGLCIRITRAQGEKLGLTFIGRGFDVRVGAPLNRSLNEALEKSAACCVKSCPTGALAFNEQFIPSPIIKEDESCGTEK